jgi:anti-sigma-K factor RskA
MTDETQSGIGEPADDSVRIGEYVLGLLPAEERTALARRIAAEPELQRELRQWQSRFTGLDAEFVEAAPPARVWSRIEDRLFAAPRAQAASVGWWQSLLFWRSLAGAAAAVAIVAVAIDLTLPQRIVPPASTEYVAGLLPQVEGAVQFVALLDSGKGALTLLGVAGQAAAPDRDYELWYINGSEPPVSLGVVPGAATTQITLDARARQAIGAGTTLAVSLEPKGGSKTGVPTGPVVSAGAATAV